MAMPIIMPKQGNTVESCTITKWYKQKGEAVKKGEALFNYETDKAAFDFESIESGTLLDIFFGDGEIVPVLTAVAVIGAPGEAYSKPELSVIAPTPSALKSSSDSVMPHQASPVKSDSFQARTSQGASPAGISPRASHLADRIGVDAASLTGSGTNGRIIERDIRLASTDGTLLTKAASARLKSGDGSMPEAGSGMGNRISVRDFNAAEQQPAGPAGEFEEVKLTNIRTIIAQRMMQSLRETAQLTLHASANATNMLAFHKAKKGAAFSFADLILTSFALSRALLQFPEVNTLLIGNKLRRYKNVHLALAVDTPRGLMVPVVQYAERLTLSEMTASIKTVFAQCTDGSINPDLLSGGTITLTALGAFGIELFTPVLNPPQVAILGVNNITPKPVLKPTGEYAFEPHLGLSLTIDHRAIDGAPAARFLQALVKTIEDINTIIPKK